MRYQLIVLSLFAVLPGMKAEAAPAPPPSAIIDIGPPPKGETAEAYLKRQIEGKTSHATLCRVWTDPEVQKLPSVAAMKDARPWLAKNLRVTAEKGGRRLRLTFRAGTAAEQVAILNAFLRVAISWQREPIKFDEKIIHMYEDHILDLEKRIKASRDPQEIASYQKGIDELRSVHIPNCQAAIAHRRQFAVIRWAK